MLRFKLPDPITKPYSPWLLVFVFLLFLSLWGICDTDGMDINLWQGRLDPLFQWIDHLLYSIIVPFGKLGVIILLMVWAGCHYFMTRRRHMLLCCMIPSHSPPLV
ncbi:MAG: hypothetical protein KJ064_23195 [Anaerolineae bacterium]|nr:hypothetical protein [Anaerolineae bacterium]